MWRTETRDKEVKGLYDGDSGSGRTAGRFCARRGIHTVRFGSTDYVHSSLTEGTSINVAQEHGAICLGRESSQLQHRETATYRGCTRKDLSWPRNPWTLFHLHHLDCRELPSSVIYWFYPGSPPEKTLRNSFIDNQLTASHFITTLSQFKFCEIKSNSLELDLANEICHRLEQSQILIWWIVVR